MFRLCACVQRGFQSSEYAQAASESQFSEHLEETGGKASVGEGPHQAQACRSCIQIDVSCGADDSDQDDISSLLTVESGL